MAPMPSSWAQGLGAAVRQRELESRGEGHLQPAGAWRMMRTLDQTGAALFGCGCSKTGLLGAGRLGRASACLKQSLSLQQTHGERCPC